MLRELRRLPSRGRGRSGKRLTEALAWELEWGSNYATLLEIQEATGLVPDALAKRPELPPALGWYLSAFYAASRGRSIHMGGAGPIPPSEILASMQLRGVEAPEERAWFERVMALLDGVYMDHQEKVSRSKSDKA